MKTQTRRMMLRSLLAASVAAGVPALALASEGCCAHCGSSQNRCRKVCRLVEEERRIATTCWGMECEEFCVPGPSTPDCKRCDFVCANEHGEKEICVRPKRIVWTTWIPGCGPEMYTKRKLMKKTVTKTVPSFKWVVEDLCMECTAQCDRISVPDGTPLPPIPKIEGLTVLAAKEQKSE